MYVRHYMIFIDVHSYFFLFLIRPRQQMVQNKGIYEDVHFSFISRSFGKLKRFIVALFSHFRHFQK